MSSANFVSSSRRNFLAAAGAMSIARYASADENDAIIGPLVGHTEPNSSILWARFPKAGRYSVTLLPRDKANDARELSIDVSEETDFTAKWIVSSLEPSTVYIVKLDGGKPCSFTTPPPPTTPARVTIAIGSCAAEDAGTKAVWSRMSDLNPDAVILAGDTPYIDSTNLTKQRERHRVFASVAEYQKLLSTRPFWSTWDDHDFGRNDADGTLNGKENSRRAFIEYRPQKAYGDGSGGIYTSFRWGPIEVFLIDARWWSWTEQSFADQKRKTLLGKVQWEWLTSHLAASTATFKLLMVGMVWEDKKSKEKDHWETYTHERDALFSFIKQKRIGGIVLLGGDIHVTRFLRYPQEYIGYPLFNFVSSPMHARVIPELNIPHPFLVSSKVQPNTFMTLTADSVEKVPTLTARFLDKDGALLFSEVTVSAKELSFNK